MSDRDTEKAEAWLKHQREKGDLKLIIFTLILGCILFFCLGLHLGQVEGGKHAILKEHCELAGGQLQQDGGCFKVTVTPVEPK
jgi:hypothetical protein